MMKRSWSVLFAVGIAASVWGCAKKRVDDQEKNNCTFLKSYNQIHVLMGGKHFTSLFFGKAITQPKGIALMKPVLYPVPSPTGIGIQRQYPLKNIDGDSNDHPHHEGTGVGIITMNHQYSVNYPTFWHARGIRPAHSQPLGAIDLPEATRGGKPAAFELHDLVGRQQII